MLTIQKLLDAIEGLPPDAQVVVGIIDGPRYNAAYAEQQVCGHAVSIGPDRQELIGEAAALYICCYEQPRPWEGAQPMLHEDGTATLRYDPEDDNPNPGKEG
ncbi:MAG: hypothetical protein HRU76_03970 [Phycisphaeraceae bacterium]|nr:MAG: hypothetical protein HRU76_03970 [Phycisphaeraceae bacterium]